MRLELACALNARGKISKVEGAKLAGVDFFRFQEALGERGISSLSLEDLRGEIESMNAVFPDAKLPVPSA